MSENEHGPDDEAAAADADAEGTEGAAEAAAEPDAGPGVARTAPSAASEHVERVIEALLFVSDSPVTPAQLARTLHAEQSAVRAALDSLAAQTTDRGVQVVEVAGGWQMRTQPGYAVWVQQYLQAKPVRLSRASLETLAIVAYRQPITRPDIDAIRGVDCGGVLKLLHDRSLVKVLGKKDEPGRPLLYGTTNGFLELFGLKSLRDLPTLRDFAELTEEHRALVEAAHGPDATVEVAEGDADGDAAAASSEAEAADHTEGEAEADVKKDAPDDDEDDTEDDDDAEGDEEEDDDDAADDDDEEEDDGEDDGEDGEEDDEDEEEDDDDEEEDGEDDEEEEDDEDKDDAPKSAA